MTVKTTSWSSEIGRLQELPELAKALELLHTDKRFNVDLSLLKELNLTVRLIGTNIAKLKTHKSNQDLQELATYFKNVQASRSRVTEIRLRLIPVRTWLRRIIDTASAALYRDGAIAKVTPQAARSLMLTAALGDLRTRLDDVEAVLDVTSAAGEALKDAYFTLKEIKDINCHFIEETLRDTA